MENSFSILIIEDDVLLNDMTKRLLTQHGYCVTSAYSGSEALLLIEKSSFDLILLDLMLPGIPGEIVLDKIKSMMDIPIIGVVENMSYLECPDCGKRISVFGEGHVEEIAAEHGIKVLAQIPIDPAIAQMVDAGRVEYLEMPWFDEAVKAVEAL